MTEKEADEMSINTVDFKTGIIWLMEKPLMLIITALAESFQTGHELHECFNMENMKLLF